MAIQIYKYDHGCIICGNTPASDLTGLCFNHMDEYKPKNSQYKSMNDYRNAWQDAYKKDPPVPLNIDIELASLCNLSCPFCFISDGSFDEMIHQPSEDGKPRRRLMLDQMAYKVIDDASEMGVPALKFNWRGESTIHPDYTSILEYARMKNTFHELLVNTNANCKDHAIPGLLAATKVMVSLDSMNPCTYQRMRVGGKLDTAKRIISLLVEENHPNLWVRRVLTKDNEGEHFFDDVKRIWGDAVNVSEHFCFDRNAQSEHESGYDPKEHRQYCGYPSQRLIVSASGIVYPCCIDLHEEMPLGNVTNQTLTEIWNSERRKKLAQELRKSEFKSEICKNCQSWMAYKSPKRDFVQDKKIEN